MGRSFSHSLLGKVDKFITSLHRIIKTISLTAGQNAPFFTGGNVKCKMSQYLTELIPRQSGKGAVVLRGGRVLLCEGQEGALFGASSSFPVGVTFTFAFAGQHEEHSRKGVT